MPTSSWNSPVRLPIFKLSPWRMPNSHGRTNMSKLSPPSRKQCVMPQLLHTLIPTDKPNLLQMDWQRLVLPVFLTQLDPEMQEHLVVHYDSRSTTFQEQRYYWCQSTPYFKESHPQESWNTSSEYKATTTPFSMNQEVQQILQITSPDIPTTCIKRSTPWNRRQKTSLMPSCRPVYQQPLPSRKYSRQCAMTHRCKPYQNPSRINTSLSKTNKLWHHTSTPSNFIILRGNTILIPSSIQSKGDWLAHKGHQGLVKTKQYARECIWIPSIDRANHCSRRVPTLPTSN